MAFRQDWTRFIGTIHNLLISSHLDTRHSPRPFSPVATTGLQYVTGNVAIARDRRLLAEVERRKGRAVAYNVHNHLR